LPAALTTVVIALFAELTALLTLLAALSSQFGHWPSASLTVQGLLLAYE
jgi:hypothetical protein